MRRPFLGTFFSDDTTAGIERPRGALGVAGGGRLSHGQSEKVSRTISPPNLPPEPLPLHVFYTSLYLGYPKSLVVHSFGAVAPVFEQVSIRRCLHYLSLIFSFFSLSFFLIFTPLPNFLEVLARWEKRTKARIEE